MEPGPSEREGDDDDGESTASRRRYHDALSTGVGMDARVHGTSTRTAPPGFPSQRGSARGPTPPSSQVGGSSPPRMFAAPGQPVGSSFNLDNVNLGGAHRSQTQTTASASNPKPTRSSFERPALLQGRSSAASDRWKAAGRATGVPDNAQEPGTKKRSGFMLAYKAVKRSMGIPSKKEKAANEKDAAKPRGAAAFASVLPPRTAAERQLGRERVKRRMIRTRRPGLSGALRTSGPPRAPRPVSRTRPSRPPPRRSPRC